MKISLFTKIYIVTYINILQQAYKMDVTVAEIRLKTSNTMTVFPVAQTYTMDTDWIFVWI